VGSSRIINWFMDTLGDNMILGIILGLIVGLVAGALVYEDIKKGFGND